MLAAALPVLASCGGDPAPTAYDPTTPAPIETNAFPKDFMWGAGCSAHQSEGGDYNSDWWVWETGGNTVSGEVSGMAADFYNRYEGDFDRLTALGLDTFRL